MVYFRQKANDPNGLIYIGRSLSKIKERFRGHQTYCEDQLISLAVIMDADDDVEYHMQFADAWVRSSFFRPTENLLSFIKQLPVNEWTNYLIPLESAAPPLFLHRLNSKKT